MVGIQVHLHADGLPMLRHGLLHEGQPVRGHRGHDKIKLVSGVAGLPEFSWYTTFQNGKRVPIGHKIYQMDIKFTKIS
jgi:hypothetical protein